MVVGWAVQGSKTRSSQSYVSVSFVQPVFEVVHLHPRTSSCSGSHRVLKLPVALNMTSGGRALPAADTHSIVVTHSCLLGAPFVAFPFFPYPLVSVSLTTRHRVD